MSEYLARRFHEVYERLAPSFGYETRTETRTFDPTTPNGKLMIAVCNELMEPDMFWDDDDPERCESSIDGVVTSRIECGGKAGETFEIQQAIRLSNITVEILIVSGSADEEDEEYGWREVPRTALQSPPANKE